MNFSLPGHSKLPVNILGTCFNKTSATYKYYWFLSILQSVEKEEMKITKRSLFSRMIANSWFTVNYFHVSFGKQDLIQKAVKEILDIEGLSIDQPRETIFLKLNHSHNPQTIKLLQHFNNQVPHWFLSPWFPVNKNEAYHELEKRIYKESKLFTSNCLYGLYENEIVINPAWFQYLYENGKVLKDFTYWNLNLFLQSKNPSVPDISGKLVKPALRSSLKKQREFWNIVFSSVQSLTCIYTNKELTIDNYAVEHFIPYSFVSHDLIWNLVPADTSFNSSKSNKLPKFEKYFDRFYTLQKTAIEIVRHLSPKNRFLEEYLTIVPELGFSSFDEDSLREKFKQTIQPLLTIASNNGFQFMQ